MEGNGGAGPSSRKQINPGKPNSRSSKLEAIKDSQDEEDKFINKNVVDNG